MREVARLARLLSSTLGEADAVALESAAWVHDIGYSPKLAGFDFHPLDGARYLHAVGAPSRVAGLVAFHSSAASEACVLGLSSQMSEFEDERTLVRDLLWYADMTVGPTGERMSFERRMEEVRERYQPDHYVIRALVAGLEERQAAVRRAERWIECVGLVDHV